jgi:hypothetical protein
MQRPSIYEFMELTKKMEQERKYSGADSESTPSLAMKRLSVNPPGTRSINAFMMDPILT